MSFRTVAAGASLHFAKISLHFSGVSWSLKNSPQNAGRYARRAWSSRSSDIQFQAAFEAIVDQQTTVTEETHKLSFVSSNAEIAERRLAADVVCPVLWIEDERADMSISTRMTQLRHSPRPTATLYGSGLSYQRARFSRYDALSRG
jgi:hypothetical protein